MALAGRHAAVPAYGSRLVGSAHGLPNGRIARVLICLDEGVLIALHGFIKKTQKTPVAELALARKRMKELKS